MTLLLHDTFTDAAGTDVVAHTSDDGHTWHYGNYTTTPSSQKIGSNHAVYATGGSPTYVVSAPSTPASGFNSAYGGVYTRVGTPLASGGQTSAFYQALDPAQGGPSNLGGPGGYGIRFSPTDTAGNGKWEIRKLPLDGSATQVLYSGGTAAMWFPTVGTIRRVTLLRTAITGGVRLAFYVDGTLVSSYDDTSASNGGPITRLGVAGMSGQGAYTTQTSGIAPTEVWVANPAANVAPPSISGTPQAGQTLNASGDTWTDTPFTVTYQWQQDLGAGFVDIASAVGSTYQVQPGDVGHPLRVTATGWGPGGVASASSTAITPTGAPTLVPTDIEVQLSGGTGNTDPRLSIGGPRGAVRIVDPTDTTGALVENILPRVLGAAAQSGQTDYVLLYVHNKHGVYGADLVAWIATQPSSTGEHLSIGAPTQPAGQDVPALPSNVTAPSGVSFSAPSNAGSGVPLGTVPAGSYRGLWIKRVTDPLTPQSTTPVTFELRVTVTQV